jgi:hypothetical protein
VFFLFADKIPKAKKPEPESEIEADGKKSTEVLNAEMVSSKRESVEVVEHEDSLDTVAITNGHASPKKLEIESVKVKANTVLIHSEEEPTTDTTESPTISDDDVEVKVTQANETVIEIEDSEDGQQQPKGSSHQDEVQSVSSEVAECSPAPKSTPQTKHKTRTKIAKEEITGNDTIDVPDEPESGRRRSSRIALQRNIKSYFSKF